MIGAGSVLLMSGAANLVIAKSLSQSASDVMALAWMMPTIFGLACVVIGGALVLAGLLT